MKIPKLRILLVDDDRDDRMFFEEALENLGLAVKFEYAANGMEAVKRLEDGADRLPDIVFLDLNMPIMSGRECLRRIRGNVGLDSIRIVIYSTSYDPVTSDLLKSMGADRYIRKPAAFANLERAISTAIVSLREGKGNVTKEDFVIHS